MKNACSSCDIERIKILLKYHPKIYYEKNEIEKYVKCKSDNPYNNVFDNDLNIIKYIPSINDLETVKLLLKEYSKELPTLLDKCEIDNYNNSDYDLKYPEGISQTLKDNLICLDSNKEYQDTRKKVYIYLFKYLNR